MHLSYLNQHSYSAHFTIEEYITWFYNVVLVCCRRFQLTVEQKIRKKKNENKNISSAVKFQCGFICRFNLHRLLLIGARQLLYHTVAESWRCTRIADSIACRDVIRRRLPHWLCKWNGWDAQQQKIDQKRAEHFCTAYIKALRQLLALRVIHFYYYFLLFFGLA